MRRAISLRPIKRGSAETAQVPCASGIGTAEAERPSAKTPASQRGAFATPSASWLPEFNLGPFRVVPAACRPSLPGLSYERHTETTAEDARSCPRRRHCHEIRNAPLVRRFVGGNRNLLFSVGHVLSPIFDPLRLPPVEKQGIGCRVLTAGRLPPPYDGGVWLGRWGNLLIVRGRCYNERVWWACRGTRKSVDQL